MKYIVLSLIISLGLSANAQQYVNGVDARIANNPLFNLVTPIPSNLGGGVNITFGATQLLGPGKYDSLFCFLPASPVVQDLDGTLKFNPGKFIAFGKFDDGKVKPIPVEILSAPIAVYETFNNPFKFKGGWVDRIDPMTHAKIGKRYDYAQMIGFKLSIQQNLIPGRPTGSKNPADYIKVYTAEFPNYPKS